MLADDFHFVIQLNPQYRITKDSILDTGNTSIIPLRTHLKLIKKFLIYTIDISKIKDSLLENKQCPVYTGIC